MESEMLK
jgi:hypothetical protein